MSSERFPGGIVLGQDEKLVARVGFSFSLPLFFLKTKLALTNRRLGGEEPNTFLGIIPVGSRQVSFPLGNIASVGASTRIKVWRLLFAIILIVIGLTDVAGLPATIVFLLLGVLLGMTGFQSSIVVTNNAGQVVSLSVVVYEKGKAQGFLDQVNQALAEGHTSGRSQ